MSLQVLVLGVISGLRPGTLSLAIPGLPPFEHLTAAHFGYAVAFGLVAPFLGRGITLLALQVRSRVEPRMVLLTPCSASEVLFSGQSALGGLIDHGADWSLGALLVAGRERGLRCR